MVVYLQLLVQTVSIKTEVVSSNPTHGEAYSIQHYVIKFVSDLRQVSGFLWLLYTTLCDKVCQWSFVTGQWFSLVTPVFSSNKTATNRHDRTEILLKVVLNTINLNPNLCLPQYKICLTFPIY